MVQNEGVLQLEDVSVVRGGTRVLRGVTATFLEGRCTAVAGPSGAGKSTLLRLLPIAFRRPGNLWRNGGADAST